jgi:glycosyltransferase involved in cell wall biosynthesis
VDQPAGSGGRTDLDVPRVVRIITRLNIGGPAIQAIDLSRELKSAGFDTHLVYGRLDTGEGDMTRLLPLDGIHATNVGDLSRPVSPPRDARALWRLYRELCRSKPDIVHTHTAKAGALGRLAALAYNRTSGRQRPARLVHTYHGHVFEGYFGSRSTRFFLRVERWLGRRTDALIAISPRIKNDLLNTYQLARETQVKVIPLGFDLDRYLRISAQDRAVAREAFQIRPDAAVIVTVGRLTAIKQHSLFLDMAGKLARQSDQVVFMIVGDGSLRPALEAQARSLGIADRVRFTGWRGDLERVYAASDVFVLTSRNEGTPVALIEAMASAVPCVSTDVGGVRDVITSPEMGAVVPFGDAQALADAVLRLMSSPALREEIGRAASLSVAHRFHSRRLVADIAALYGQLLESPRSA